MSDYERALAFVLEREGGYSDHPSDPGGATNHGITQSTYDFWRSRSGEAEASVEVITVEEVGEIYRAAYWAGAAESQPWPVSLVVFDSRVQHGRWALLVQRAANACGGDADGEPIVADGAWGPRTAAAVKWRADEEGGRLDAAIVAERLEYYTALDGWPTFGRGWARRLAELLRECLPGA
jgi:lysozyme family protein